MSKIIIDHDPDVSPVFAVAAVKLVIEDGLVSEARGHQKYCHFTVVGGTRNKFTYNVCVYARDRRHSKAPHSFHVYRAP